MIRYQILLEYEGTQFNGWQIQKSGNSVQKTVQLVLSKLLRKRIKIHGAGRTDKGVHASGQFANFKSIKRIDNKKKFLSSINFFLGKSSISIIDIKKKKKDFHARFSAKERVYTYYIVNRLASLTLDKNKAWHVRRKINLDLLKKGGKTLVGTHDFSTFRASTCTAKSAIKKMNSIVIKKNQNKIILTFKSKSFLQNQVRSMVGCLEKLSSSEWSLKKFKEVLKSKKRTNCAPPAPAYG